MGCETVDLVDDITASAAADRSADDNSVLDITATLKAKKNAMVRRGFGGHDKAAGKETFGKVE